MDDVTAGVLSGLLQDWTPESVRQFNFHNKHWNFIDPGEQKLLILAAAIGLDCIVQLLLMNGTVDPNEKPEHYALPLIGAAKQGHVEVIEAMTRVPEKVDFTVPVSNNDKSTALHCLLRAPFEPLRFETVTISVKENIDKYRKCILVILNDVPEKQLKVLINAKDHWGNTPLHYAIKYWSSDVINALLDRGADLLFRNLHDESALDAMTPEVFESILDNVCLTFDGELNDKDFKATANYDIFVPLQLETRSVDKDDEALTTKDSYEYISYPETELLWQLSQSEKHRRLLKHPVITLFLWLKWNRVNWYYNANLIFYILFVASLTAYIFCLYGGQHLGNEIVWNSQNCKLNDMSRTVTGLWYINVVMVFGLLIREILQMLIMPHRYFRSFENGFEIVLIGFALSLLALGAYTCHVTTSRHIAALVIVLSMFELNTMIGKHPFLGKFTSYVTMFYKVLTTFSVFLIW